MIQFDYDETDKNLTLGMSNFVGLSLTEGQLRKFIEDTTDSKVEVLYLGKGYSIRINRNKQIRIAVRNKKWTEVAKLKAEKADLELKIKNMWKKS
ncbi:hypothetical protein [Clostridium cibarium]|uniref:Uncharacterized protein n=1 Tax=Clostridium cibarium TaxID=2762247 RepID=A0ABR8PTH7_9CLOT|nr:hypothetical protein [Clostridium cibarium]MBD7911472.1 hypothetical protein [Clostridium cibarium]